MYLNKNEYSCPIYLTCTTLQWGMFFLSPAWPFRLCHSMTTLENFKTSGNPLSLLTITFAALYEGMLPGCTATIMTCPCVLVQGEAYL